jgi:hypothetical protein
MSSGAAAVSTFVPMPPPLSSSPPPPISHPVSANPNTNAAANTAIAGIAAKSLLLFFVVDLFIRFSPVKILTE